MSGLTLAERLERLNQLDSTIPENARDASSKPPWKDSDSHLSAEFLKIVELYQGVPDGCFVYNGKYDNLWLKDHIKEIEEIVTGIPLVIEMSRNQQSVGYSGRRTVKRFSYESSDITPYVVLEFPEGDQLKFATAGLLLRERFATAGLLVCGSNPHPFISGTLFDTKEGVLKFPDEGQIKERTQYRNSLYFESDGYLHLKFGENGR